MEQEVYLTYDKLYKMADLWKSEPTWNTHWLNWESLHEMASLREMVTKDKDLLEKASQGPVRLKITIEEIGEE